MKILVYTASSSKFILIIIKNTHILTSYLHEDTLHS